MGTNALLDDLVVVLGNDAVASGDRIHPDDLHDESLHPRDVTPLAVVRPRDTAQVAAVAKLASRYRVPLTPRGSGTGLSGAAVPVNGGLVVSFSRMNQVLRVDVNDHVAVVQPGVTLSDLAEALVGTGLRYPVYPGELSGSIGGNVNTNAGGMRAVRHGVTRQHVIGLELVLMDGTIVRTGGPVMKTSSGYDLTQLVIGSEGTLALVTEVTLRLSPDLVHAATVLVPFASIDALSRTVPTIVASGLAPSILEYVDVLVMGAITRAAELELAVNADVASRTTAYLIIVLETRSREQLDADLEVLATQLDAAGALDVYVLASHVAAKLIEARERAFWSAKSSGAHDIIDIVVPRSTVPEFLASAQEIAGRHGTFLTGCGHVGDGNVHFSIFQPDETQRHAFLHELFAAGVALGGAISGEHGIGRDKQTEYLALSDPTLLGLQRAIKRVFDPNELLNPYRLLDERPLP